jgi:hypothetical protein
MSGVTPRLAKDVKAVQDPRLALLLSLEMAKGEQAASYLDDIVRKYRYSELDIVSIKPDLYRLCHESKLVADKLRTFKLEVPEYFPEALVEPENTNPFTLVPMTKN